jgi:hypothetical protein
MKEKQLTGWKFFSIGLMAFLGLGFDLFVIGLDLLVFGSDFNYNNPFQNPWYMLLFHWCVVITLWIVFIIFLVKWLAKKGVREEVFSLKITKATAFYCLLAVLFSFGLAFLEIPLYGRDGFGFQIAREYQRFIEQQGPTHGLILSITQNVYYIFESMLVLLLLALTHRAGEKWFGKYVWSKFIPFGGIFLMLTWGLGHFTHGVFSMIWITVFALMAGIFFILNQKRVLPTYIFIWMLFVI